MTVRKVPTGRNRIARGVSPEGTDRDRSLSPDHSLLAAPTPGIARGRGGQQGEEREELWASSVLGADAPSFTMPPLTGLGLLLLRL